MPANSTNWTKSSPNSTNWTKSSPTSTNWRPEDNDPSAGSFLLQNGDNLLLQNDFNLSLQ